MNNTLKRETRIRVILLTFLLFSIEFDVHITGFITLRKIALLILFVSYIMKKYKFGSIKIPRREIMVSALIVYLFLYTFMIVNVISGAKNYEGSYQVVNLIVLLLYVVLIPIMLTATFKSVLEFIKCQWYVTLFQTVIVLIGRLFLPFRLFVYIHFSYGDGRLLEGIENGIRSVGIDLAGASGSMILYAGLICGIYLFYHSNTKEKRRILFGYMFVMVALLFMGRTGLYFGLAGILIVFADCICRRDSIAKLIVGLGIIVAAAILIYINVAPDSWGLKMWIKWITELMHLFDETSAIRNISEMNIPALTQETFWGTGMVYGVTPSGLVLNHDSGYIRMYTAIGLVGCIAYYGIIYSYYLSIINKVSYKRDKKIYFFFLTGVIIAEMKEPFLLKTPIAIIMSCMLLLEMTQKYQLKKRMCLLDLRDMG